MFLICNFEKLCVQMMLAAFPLPFKLGQSKLRIENTANGNTSIKKKKYAHKVFRQSEKGIFRKTVMDFFFNGSVCCNGNTSGVSKTSLNWLNSTGFQASVVAAIYT